MGIGAGILLLIVGLIIVTGAVEIPDRVEEYVATDTVGWICVAVGILGLALALTVNRRQSRSTRIEERAEL
ncbi:DUF6458 family protein [Nocardioides sp.]|uniref:DUF6458 family protein n=1 Tax=Nocardioides sp. TaxID=35761 RepID=UPI0035665BB8